MQGTLERRLAKHMEIKLRSRAQHGRSYVCLPLSTRHANSLIKQNKTKQREKKNNGNKVIYGKTKFHLQTGRDSRKSNYAEETELFRVFGTTTRVLKGGKIKS